jgi:hypothetical protein
MKKLAVLLQIVGLLAVCPIYVILEIRHSGIEKSEINSGSSTKSNTEIMESKVPGNNTHNTTHHSITK